MYYNYSYIVAIIYCLYHYYTLYTIYLYECIHCILYRVYIELGIARSNINSDTTYIYNIYLL